MPRILAAIALVALFSTTIYAQDDDAPIEMEVEKKLVVDVPSAQFASDHASTVGHWGVQVASLDGAPVWGYCPSLVFVSGRVKIRASREALPCRSTTRVSRNPFRIPLSFP